VEREFSAGGVLVRTIRGRAMVAAIRPRGKQRVWALPKGHIDAGESAAETAMREVREETGVEAELVDKLGDIRYWYMRGGRRIAKVVSFFLLEYVAGELEDHDHEVERAEWMALAEAARRLTYRGERDMAAAALSRRGKPQ
jgi:8-oxo-dGTP pyrophosphatase MutT (NUDIX family)